MRLGVRLLNLWKVKTKGIIQIQIKNIKIGIPYTYYDMDEKIV